MVSNTLRGIIAAAVTATGTQAFAADVQRVQGLVTLNGQSVIQTATAPPGATVRVPGQGLARIYYENGCTEVVNAYETRVVQSDPVCNTGGAVEGGLTLPFVTALGTAGALGVVIWNSGNNNGPVSP
jgi:hypothetical protein